MESDLSALIPSELMESDLSVLHLCAQVCDFFNGAQVTSSCALRSIFNAQEPPQHKQHMHITLAKVSPYKASLSVFLFKVFKFLLISQAQWKMNVNPRGTNKTHQISPTPSPSTTPAPLLL